MGNNVGLNKSNSGIEHNFQNQAKVISGGAFYKVAFDR